MSWVPCSADLTPLGFFFWEYSKGQIYVMPLPSVLENLKEKIQNAVGNVVSGLCIGKVSDCIWLNGYLEIPHAGISHPVTSAHRNACRFPCRVPKYWNVEKKLQ
jgi:hypothetical protein